MKNIIYMTPVFIMSYILSSMGPNLQFLIGFGTGVYVGTYYNVKPIVKMIETETADKMQEFKKFLKENEKEKIDDDTYTNLKKTVQKYFGPQN